MAAYAATVTLDHPAAKKLSNGVAVLNGSVNISNYNQTLAEITAITGSMRVLFTVVGGVTSNGYLAVWDSTGKAFKCWGTGASAGAALQQVASDVDVGSVDFLVVGLAP